MDVNSHRDAVGFIWSVAELLRHDYRPSEYGRVVLPFVVLRRLDCVLHATKQAVLDKATALPASIDEKMRDAMLCMASGQSFYNVSKFAFDTLTNDANHIAANLNNYVNGFPAGVRDIFIDRFKLTEQIDRLDDSNLLFLIVSRFNEIDLHTDVVDNHAMGLIFEELIRRFAEQSNETAGEHFTPREVIRLMVNLLFSEDRDALTKTGVRTLYDPACGTGGMLSVAEDYLREMNSAVELVVFGQEINAESYAICKSDMMLKGQDPARIKYGNTFTDDGLTDETFDYMLSNPPFGVDWKKYEGIVRNEADTRGMGGRFGVGLPRVSDGSLLFVQHMISKFRTDGTSRIAVVLNGSPLFTGGAGSGESEIRRWIIENDWLEAIIAMPDNLFYNTGISTYVWLITNHKTPERRGKIQLVNAADLSAKMRKALGEKRNLIPDDAIEEITRIFGEFRQDERSKAFDNEDFGYWRITVERPLRLNFAIINDRIAQVEAQTGFQNLAKSKKKGKPADDEIAEGRTLQRAILSTLREAAVEGIWQDRDRFIKHLKGLFKADGVTLPANVFNAVLSGLSERDETAPPCLDRHGQPEPDPDLRDNENVPLKEDIQTYFEREVLPHVPDAWIDESKTKKGYEIPFTRHFYRYVPPRPLDEIDRDLKELVGEIQTMLTEVVG